MVGQVGSPVQGSEALLISLVDFCPYVEQVVHLRGSACITHGLLQHAMTGWDIGMHACIRACGEKHAAAALYHVQLLVGGGKVQGRPCPIVLGDKVGVGVHDLGQLLWLSQAHCAVELYGLVEGLWWVPGTGGVSLSGCRSVHQWLLLNTAPPSGCHVPHSASWAVPGHPAAPRAEPDLLLVPILPKRSRVLAASHSECWQVCKRPQTAERLFSHQPARPRIAWTWLGLAGAELVRGLVAPAMRRALQLAAAWSPRASDAILLQRVSRAFLAGPSPDLLACPLRGVQQGCFLHSLAADRRGQGSGLGPKPPAAVPGAVLQPARQLLGALQLGYPPDQSREQSSAAQAPSVLAAPQQLAQLRPLLRPLTTDDEHPLGGGWTAWPFNARAYYVGGAATHTVMVMHCVCS